MSTSLSFPQPPWTGLGKALESAVRKALYDFQLLEGTNRLAVAVSGGKDSLTLLFLLHAISGRGFPPFELVPIYIGGDATCGASVDASYLADICSKMGLELEVRESTQQVDDLECYSCSRERRGLLFSAAKTRGCNAIAFGHHRDDNAQTLLMNLLHKGEFAGMLPKLFMQKYDITIIRPLIYIAEADIVTFAKQHGFSRITCRCPVGQRSLRRKTENLLCEIEQLFPNARMNVATAALVYGSDKAAHSID